ncbi:MAG TPA: hypothetical protein VH186_02655 [Chloroflexia bacterium]|nr:hypothetical protein [Chloroflexia bacterium]
MKQVELEKQSTDSKEALCREIERLQSEVNELALKICCAQGSDVNYIWSNLANARAYLTTALESARHLKSGKLREINGSSDWQI